MLEKQNELHTACKHYLLGGSNNIHFCFMMQRNPIFSITFDRLVFFRGFGLRVYFMSLVLLKKNNKNMKEDQNMPVRFCCSVISSIRNILLQCCFDKDMTNMTGSVQGKATPEAVRWLCPYVHAICVLFLISPLLL